MALPDGPTVSVRGDGEVEDPVLGLETADLRAKVRLSDDGTRGW